MFTGLNWHAIGCGVWKDWAVQHNFLGLDYRTRTITLRDDGNGKFNTPTMQNMALALLRTLLDLEKYTNKEVYIPDDARSQRELLEAIERISGKQWTLKSISSSALIAEEQRAYAEGDLVTVVALSGNAFATGHYGGWFEEDQKQREDLEPGVGT